MIESNLNKDLERKIDLYINGKLSEEQVDELWAELVQNEYYLDYTKSVANLKQVILDRRKADELPPTYRLRKVASYGVAAAIAIIIGVIGVLNYTASNSPAELDALAWIEYDTYRSSNDSPAITNNEVIKTAIRLANDGNTEEAIGLLEKEISEVSDTEEIALLSLSLGSIQYNYGNYSDALESFSNVITKNDINKLILEKGYWYLANTYVQLEKLPEAEQALQNTIELDGQYSRVAESYLNAINKVR
jgi:tetratricopeptide (TPR) repeat protein